PRSHLQEPVRGRGIRDRPISPRSPWQNGYVERLIGTLRRECLDQMLVFGEAHLRRILCAYAAYYNQSRMHLSLHKDAPLGRAIQRYGTIAAIPAPSLRANLIFGRDRHSRQQKPSPQNWVVPPQR